MKLQKREAILLYILGIVLVVMLGVLLIVMPMISTHSELSEKRDIAAAERVKLEKIINQVTEMDKELQEAKAENEKLKDAFLSNDVVIGTANYDLSDKQQVLNFFYDQVLKSEEGAAEDEEFYMHSVTATSYIDDAVDFSTDGIKIVGYTFSYSMVPEIGYNTFDDFIRMLDRLSTNENLKNVYFNEFSIDEIKDGTVGEENVKNIVKGKFSLLVAYAFQTPAEAA